MGKRIILTFFYKDYGRTLKLEDRLEEYGWGRDPVGFYESKGVLAIALSFGLSLFGSLYFENGIMLTDAISIPRALFSLVLFAFGLYLGCMLPELYLHFLHLELSCEKKEEQLRLERILVLLKDYSRMNGEILLEYLKEFGDSYEKELSALQKSYLRKEETELELSRVKQRELGFLLRGIKAMDQVPIAKAFSSLPSYLHFQEKELAMEKRRQEKDRAALSRTVTFLPLFLTVGLYLILPFVVEGLGRIAAYSDSFVTYL